MHFPTFHNIGDAAKLPVPNATQAISVAPIEIPFPGRQAPLEVRVSFPASVLASTSTASKLPVVILSHGGGPNPHTSSLHGYAPTRDFWAAHGLVVIQPTHLDSKTLGLDINPANIKHVYLDARAADVSRIIDVISEQDSVVEQAIPQLRGMLDTSKIGMAGHSFGGLTTSTILGAVNRDSDTATATTDLTDKRVKAGVIFAGTGNGGDKNLSEQGKMIMPFYNIDFSNMHTPALVVYGDEDVQPYLTTRGADWHADPYFEAPGRKAMLTLKGARHGLGGIAGFELSGADDDDVERLHVVLRASWAYLWSALHDEDTKISSGGAWAGVVEAMKGLGRVGDVQSKE